MFLAEFQRHIFTYIRNKSEIIDDMIIIFAELTFNWYSNKKFRLQENGEQRLHR